MQFYVKQCSSFRGVLDVFCSLKSQINSNNSVTIIAIQLSFLVVFFIFRKWKISQQYSMHDQQLHHVRFTCLRSRNVSVFARDIGSFNGHEQRASFVYFCVRITSSSIIAAKAPVKLFAAFVKKTSRSFKEAVPAENFCTKAALDSHGVWKSLAKPLRFGEW